MRGQTRQVAEFLVVVGETWQRGHIHKWRLFIQAGPLACGQRPMIPVGLLAFILRYAGCHEYQLPQMPN